MTRIARLCLPLLLIPALASGGSPVVFQDRGGELEVSTSSTLAVFRHGAVVRLQNRLTGQEFCDFDPGARPAERTRTALAFQDGEVVYADPASASSRVATSDQAATQTTRLGAGHLILTRVWGAADGSIAVRQEARATTTGLEAATLGIPVLRSEDVAVLIPTGSGLRLGRGFAGVRDFPWPADWRVQFAVIEGRGSAGGRAGGIAVWAEDPRFDLFKSIRFQGAAEGDRLGLGLTTYVPQPVARASRGRSAEWRIGGYEGPWTAAAQAQKKRLPVLGEAAAKGAGEREWVQSIDLIVTPARMREKVSGPLDLEKHVALLDALAKRVDPRRTLLNYAYDWRTHEMGSVLPQLNVDVPNAPKLMDHARALGFRTMITADIRCDLRHPFYPELRRAHMRYGRPQAPPYGQSPSPIGAEYCSFVQLPLWKARLLIAETQLAAINPAYTPWRRLTAGQVVAVAAKLRPDAIHLEGATYCNDANGLIEGRNSIQGLRQLLLDLRAALPAKMALSVDAWDEVTRTGADLAQLRLPGFYEVDRSKPEALRFDEAWAARVHPISGWLLRNELPPYATLDQSSARFTEAWADWDIATAALGPVPHATEVDAPMLASPPAPLQSRLIWAKAIGALEGQVDPAGWVSGQPQTEWAGARGRLRLALLPGAKAAELTRQPANSVKQDLLFRATLDGRYELPPAPSRAQSAPATAPVLVEHK